MESKRRKELLNYHFHTMKWLCAVSVMDIEWISDVKKSLDGWDKEDGPWALTPILRTCFSNILCQCYLFHGLLFWEMKINRLFFSESHAMNCGNVK